MSVSYVAILEMFSTSDGLGRYGVETCSFLSNIVVFKPYKYLN
jgi:hypothetical protein